MRCCRFMSYVDRYPFIQQAVCVRNDNNSIFVRFELILYSKSIYIVRVVSCKNYPCEVMHDTYFKKHEKRTTFVVVAIVHCFKSQ